MFAASAAVAEDWPTYQHDVARTGVTSEPVQPPLEECWKHRSRYAPQPAWGDPKPVPIEGIPELRRRHFDDVYQVVVANGAAYFGSSADHKVYCLDLADGKIRWTFATGGPVRLAPAIAQGRAYFGSDDGWVYCLNATDGRMVWRFHAAPSDERVLGHGKMISLWPVRTGVLVDSGVAYFGAGIFPAEGVFVYAVDATDGKLIWRNDTCGEAPQSTVSPQGYLLASATTLYAPMGRVSPGAFDRRDGKLKFQSYFGKDFGGTYAMLVDGGVYTGTEKLVGYREGTQRDRFAVFAGRKLIVSGPRAYLATGDRLMALDRVAYPKASVRCETLRGQIADLKARSAGGANQDRLEQMRKQLEAAERDLQATIPWQVPCEASDALILAGKVLYAGGAGQVLAIDADSGKPLWKSAVEGSAKGLAAAAGRLLASTDKGIIYCFGPPGMAVSQKLASDPRPPAEEPRGNSASGPAPRLAQAKGDEAAQAAEAILKQTGIRRGYCLVVGCKTGQLAIELARRSDLMVYGVARDAADAEAACRAVDAAGLAGARICIEHGTGPKLPYSDYFANLVVAEPGGTAGFPPEELLRVLKPLGGAAMLGQPTGLPDAAWPGTKLVRKDEQWVVLERGPLPGAGSWTHQYAEPGNTACSDDEAVQGPLGLLWFGNPGPGPMVNRHERAASPLSIDGRLFIQGENVLMAYDAYNGLKLWEREIAGAMRVNASHDGSNLALSHQRLFVALRDTCLGLDPATGETKITYAPPPSPDGKSRRIGCVLHADNTLYASQGTRPTVSDRVVAWDVASGKVRWVYEGRSIGNNTIAFNEGRLLLIDADLSPAERRTALAALPEAERPGADLRTVVALDGKTGQVLWKKPMNLAFCGGSNLAVMASRGVLVIFGVYLDGHYWQQFFAGDFASRRVAVLDASDGKLLWSKAVGYRVRPLIIGDTLHAEPWAFDLATGKERTRVHPVTGQADRWQFARPGHHCGCPNASPHCLFFRSLCLGYYDLVRDFGTMHFGAQRPGCWINMIPAAGLLLVPEASTGCMCPFPNMCTVVFKPRASLRGWGYFSAPGAMTPVERLAINLGAAGDRLDASGKLWLGYPRPSGSLVLQFKLDAAFLPGGAFHARSNAFTTVAGTDAPWLFASAARGLRRCAIPLLGPGDGAAVYRVRLGFADPDNDRPGVRVFDVKLQGKTVLKDFDIVAAAGARDKAVFKDFSGIEVSDHLLLELVPANANPKSEAEQPILQAIEIVRQKVLRVGCAVSDLLMSTMEPKRSVSVKLANLCDTPFEGTLEASAPKGFAVSPNRVSVRLEAGARSDLPVEVSLVGEAPAGKYPLTIRLLRSDGKIETETSASIEHLGRRARMVVAAVEDAHVQKRYPELNRGSAGVLLVDGGNAAMGDLDHAVAYVKFRFHVPGKVLGVRFRIRNAGNPSGDCGRLCLVTESWEEKQITYARRPALGMEVGRLGAAAENQLIERPLKVDLQGRTELSLAIDPTSTDGVDFLSRESGSPPELVIDYEPER